MDLWDYEDFGLDFELFSAFKVFVQNSQPCRSAVFFGKFGKSGAHMWLDKLSKLNLIEGYNPEYFGDPKIGKVSHSGLLESVLKMYFSEIRSYHNKFDVDDSVWNSTVKVLDKFFETSFYKKYFHETFYSNIREYNSFFDLVSIPRDLLEFVDLDKKPVRNVSEFNDLFNAATMVRENFGFESKQNVLVKVDDYFCFVPTFNEIYLIETIEKEWLVEKHFAPLDVVKQKLTDRGLTEQEIEDSLKNLYHKGKLVVIYSENYINLFSIGSDGDYLFYGQ